MINSKLSESIGDGEFNHNGNLFYFNNFNIKWIEELGVTPKVIIDVGAYDFGDSIRYKLSFPECQIFSFEADLERYNKTIKFAENCGINTYNNAVFSRTDIIDFYPAKCNIKDLGTFHSPGETAGQGSVFVMTEKYKNIHPHIQQNEHPVKVNSITIEDLCSDKKIDTVSLLQIDAEGSELEVLKGLGTIRPKLIYLEIQENLFKNECSAEIVSDFLKNIGYIIVKDLGVDKLYIHS